MTKKQKTRYLKNIVSFCIAFPAAFGVAGLFVCWHTNSDPTGIVQAVITAYTVELGLTCVLKLLDKDKKEEKQNDVFTE